MIKIKHLSSFKYLVILLLLTAYLYASSQPLATFQTTIDGLCVYSEYAYSSAETNDSGYVVVGHTACQSQGGGDIVLVKLNKLAQVEWAKIYGGSGSDYGYKIIPTADNGFTIAGVYHSSINAYDMVLFHTNNIGDTVWSKAYHSTSLDHVYNMAQTTDKGYALVGQIRTNGFNDIAVIRTDSLGNIVWTRIFDLGSNDTGTDIIELNDSGFVIVGSVGDGPVTDDRTNIIVIRLDNGGNILWSTMIRNSEYVVDSSYLVNSNPRGYSICLNKNNDLVVCGYLIWIDSIGNGVTYMRHLVLMEMSTLDGSIHWSKEWGKKTFHDTPYSVKCLENGDLLIGGCRYGINEDFYPRDLFLIRTDSIGNIIYNKLLGFEKTEYGGDLTLTKDGGVLITASSQDDVYSDLYIAKVNVDGNFFCHDSDFVLQAIAPTIVDSSFIITSWITSFTTYVPNLISGNYSYSQDEYCYLECNNIIEIIGDSILCGGQSLTLYVSSGYSSYSWSTGSTDTSIQINTEGVYYISATDENGCIYTDTLTVINCSSVINELASYDDIIIYPNPAKEKLYILNNSENEIREIEIFNSVGKKINKYSFKNDKLISVSLNDMTNGPYQIIILDYYHNILQIRTISKY